MTFTTRSILILFVNGMVHIIYSASTAMIARLLRLPIREIGIFSGPRLFGFSISGIRVSIRLLPLGSFVRLEDTENDHSSSGIIKEVHPIYRTIFQLAGPLGLISVAILVLGFRDAMHTFKSAYLLPVDIIRGAVQASSLFVTMYEAIGRLTLIRFISAACTYYAAFNLYPIPSLPGGVALITCAELIFPIPSRVRERLLMIGWFLTVIVLVAFLFLFIKFAFSMCMGGA